MAEKMRALYRGNGKTFLDGIPMRNLSEDDYQSLSTEQRKELRDSSLYEVRTDSEMASSTTPRTRAASPTTSEPAANAPAESPS